MTTRRPSEMKTMTISENQMIMRTLIFPNSHDSGEIVPTSQYMKQSLKDAVFLIGKIMKIIGVHVENSSFDDVEPEMSWRNRVSGVQTKGPPT